MAIQGCRNVIEELVVSEVIAQNGRLSSSVKAKTNIDEVASYALNRLPPLYATTRRGYLHQQKLACKDFKSEIAQTISRGLIGVKKDILKDATPLPECELEREERSLLRLQKILEIDNLRWRDVPSAVEKTMMNIKLKMAVSYNSYKNKSYSSASNLSSYLKQNSERLCWQEMKWKSKDSLPYLEDSITQMTEMSEFASYIAPASWNFVNTLENLVAAIAQRQIDKLDLDLVRKVTLEEVSAHALNRLPPMYATSANGLTYWRNRARVELSSEILITVQQAVAYIVKSPSRFLPPLACDKFSTEQEIAIDELKDILQINDLDWRNAPMVVQDAFTQFQNGEMTWIPRDRR